jgi:hypothetical protein
MDVVRECLPSRGGWVRVTRVSCVYNKGVLVLVVRSKNESVGCMKKNASKDRKQPVGDADSWESSGQAMEWCTVNGQGVAQEATMYHCGAY